MWNWEIKSRYRSMNEPFFNEGNSICLDKYRNFFWNFNEDDESGNEKKSLDTMDVDQIPVIKKEYPCMVENCQQTFYSFLFFELHYDTQHRNTCLECLQRLPNKHLLELHIQEKHSSLFDQQQLKCFVISCNFEFETCEERKNHLISIHHYPRCFRYFKFFDTKIAKSKSNNSQIIKEPSKLTPSVEVSNNLTKQLDQMEVEIATDDPFTQSKPLHCKNLSYTRKVPKQICFGAGRQVCFNRSCQRSSFL